MSEVLAAREQSTQEEAGRAKEAALGGIQGGLCEAGQGTQADRLRVWNALREETGSRDAF